MHKILYQVAPPLLLSSSWLIIFSRYFACLPSHLNLLFSLILCTHIPLFPILLFHFISFFLFLSRHFFLFSPFFNCLIPCSLYILFTSSLSLSLSSFSLFLTFKNITQCEFRCISARFQASAAM
jgi:hypothetical protein